MTVSRTICLGFLAVIAMGALLLMTPIASSQGMWLDPLTALFTSTSAVCVTGLSVVDVGTFYSFWGQLIIAILVQIGGLGYMTTTTFLLLIIGAKFRLRDKIAIQQALDRTGMQGSRQVIISIIATTAIFEIGGTLLLLPAFQVGRTPLEALWQAVFHSINSWNNAGFSLFKDSLIGYQSNVLLNLTVSGLVVFGGIGYQTILEVFIWCRDRLKNRSTRLSFSFNFKVATTTTAILLLVGTLAIWAIESRNPETLAGKDLGTQLLAAWFQSVTPRTAGFNTIDYSKMASATLFITIVLMFIGASPGGTGGGMKTTTLRVLTSATKAILEGKEEVILYRRKISTTLVFKAVGVFIGSFATVVLATIIICLTDPKFKFIEVLFEVFSAFSTVGLSMGITGSVSALAKSALIATMYVGRVGVLLLMSALLGDPAPSRVNYPEENLLVG